MKKVYYNKLIRDKIPGKIIRSGGTFKIKRLGKSGFKKELVKKVGEEASGLVRCRTKEEIVSELADVLDAVDELKRLHRISTRRMVSAQKHNRRMKGGFKKRIFLIWSSDTGYKTSERRYKR